MKKRLLLFIFCSAILSCSNKAVDNSNATEKTIIKKSITAPTKTGEIQINMNFPFGCADLVKYKYPKHWEGDLKNYGHLKQPKGKEFEDLGQCFGSLNKVESQQKKPEIIKTHHIKIGENFQDTLYYDTIAQQKTENLKYRLPDIGKYQCYYFFEQSYSVYGYYGNLLLLDPKSKEGKTLNIYNEVSGDQHMSFRYFYLDGKTLRIYEGSYYDDGCGLTEKFNVNINTDGQITINELK